MDEPEAKRLKMDVRRQKLEARYLNRKFVDKETSEGPRTINALRYEEEDAVWVAQTSDENGNDQDYYLNGESGMDDMIAAYRDKQGKAIEVLWEVHDEERDEALQVWWRAEVVGQDGTHVLANDDEKVEIDAWTIRYDARPELSEPEPVAHKVCFLSSRALFDVTSEDAVMQWRPEGATDQAADLTEDLIGDEDVDVPKVEAIVDAAVAAALDGALKTKFDSLPRDKQCAVAEVVVAAKDKLKNALNDHVANKEQRTVTPDDISAVLASIKGDLADIPALIMLP